MLRHVAVRRSVRLQFQQPGRIAVQHLFRGFAAGSQGKFNLMDGVMHVGKRIIRAEQNLVHAEFFRHFPDLGRAGEGGVGLDMLQSLGHFREP